MSDLNLGISFRPMREYPWVPARKMRTVGLDHAAPSAIFTYRDRHGNLLSTIGRGVGYRCIDRTIRRSIRINSPHDNEWVDPKKFTGFCLLSDITVQSA